MRPVKGSDVVNIPLTFDSNSKIRITSTGRKIYLLLFLGFWVISSIFAILGGAVAFKLLYPIISFVVLSWILRFAIMKESYFKKKREELIENKYKFPHSTFWNIYEINRHGSYNIAQFADGTKGIFIAFDKDVIVGKQDYDDYYHYESIADAIQQCMKRGISCLHIDYMDTVGKDDRIDGLFHSADSVKNPELRKVLTSMYDNIAFNMNRSYASYDVYAFYFKGRTDLFCDELDGVLDRFLEANYIRYRSINKEGLSVLVESVMGVHEFSVNKACESLFKEMNTTDYLNVIWVESGDERTILDRTLEEKEEVRRIYTEESKLRKLRRKKDREERKRIKKQNKRGKSNKQKIEEVDTSDEIDLF